MNTQKIPNSSPENPFPKGVYKNQSSLKLILIIFLLLTSILVLVAISGIAGFYFGKSKGYQEALLVLEEIRRNVAPGKDSLPSSPKISKQNSKNLSSKKEQVPLSGLPPSLLKLPEGEGGDLQGYMGQLDGLLQQWVPQEPGKVEPTKEILSLVRKGRDNSKKAIQDYLDKVQKDLETTQNFSPTNLLAGARNPELLAQGKGDLDQVFKKLSAMTVPPECTTLHAYYLTLITDLRKLMDLQNDAQNGEPEALFNAMTLSRRLIALQRIVHRLENELKTSS